MSLFNGLFGLPFKNLDNCPIVRVHQYGRAIRHQIFRSQDLPVSADNFGKSFLRLWLRLESNDDNSSHFEIPFYLPDTGNGPSDFRQFAANQSEPTTQASSPPKIAPQIDPPTHANRNMPGSSSGTPWKVYL